MAEQFEEDPLDRRLRDGDEQALAELFESNHARLWRMVRFRMDSRLMGRVDPDDVLQEAFLDARTRLQHFDGGMTPFLWLRWVVQQTLIAVHRRHLGAQMRSVERDVRIFGGPATSAALAAQLAGTPTSPSDAAIRGEQAKLIGESLDQMSELDQEVLALRHFEDLANHEVAEALDISTKAASIRYVRALSRLRKLLDKSDAISKNWEKSASDSSATSLGDDA